MLLRCRNLSNEVISLGRETRRDRDLDPPAVVRANVSESSHGGGASLGYSMQMKRLVPAVLVLVMVLGGTAISTWSAVLEANSTARRLLRADAMHLTDSLTDAMKTYEQTLRSGVGFLNARGTVSRDEWRVFVRSLALDREFPGIQGLGYVEQFNPDRIDAHVAEQRRNGRPGYELTPDGVRDHITAIVYLEPETWRNQRAIGYDMFTEATRRAAMERARDTGLPSISRKVTLIQETDDQVQPGALLYLPIFTSVDTPNSIEQRQRDIRGYIYGAFRLKDFFKETLFKNSPGTMARVRTEVFDGDGVTAQQSVFDSFVDAKSPASRASASEPPARIRDTLTFDLAGASWTMRVSARPALERSVDWSKPWTIFTFGTLISVLVGGIVASLTLARDRSLVSEQRLAAEIVERKRAQDQLQLSNHELIHRVKNTLAIVSAMASQTARYSASLKEFSTAFRERLAALGRVHDQLGADPAFSPELRTFMNESLSPYSGENATALTISGPSVLIRRNEAVLMSLLINELATNATKYGAWSTPGGMVTVEWAIEPNTTGEYLGWSWTESNGPKVAPPQRTGFGTSVIQSIERGLGGTIETDFAPDGFRCLLRFPRPGTAVHPQPADGDRSAPPSSAAAAA